MTDKNPLLGVVLCGGASSRMGTDKGLLKTNNECWVVLQRNKLESLSIPTEISINSNQLDSYGVFFSRESLIVDQNLIKGPLNGLLSVHNKFPDRDLLVLACDLIDIEPRLVKQLIKQYAVGNSAYDCVVFTNNGLAEPLCGIYSSAALKQILQLSIKGKLKNYSMQHALSIAKTKYLSLEYGEQEQFKNYNMPEP